MIELPWPFLGLWPNDREHWRVKAKAVRSYRSGARVIAIYFGNWDKYEGQEILVTFCPKSRGRVPDMDNCIAAFKAGQDGIADALGVDDGGLKFSYAMGERCKDGAVIVEMRGQING